MNDDIDRVYTGTKVRFSVNGQTLGIDGRSFESVNVIAIKND